MARLYELGMSDAERILCEYGFYIRLIAPWTLVNRCHFVQGTKINLSTPMADAGMPLERWLEERLVLEECSVYFL